MLNKNKVIEGLEWVLEDDRFGFGTNWTENSEPKSDEERAGYNIQMAISLLKEQGNLLGIQQTADSITFLSTGTAQQGEERGLLLGKAFMHEWLEKELLHSGLLTDEIRKVFDKAKNL